MSQRSSGPDESVAVTVAVTQGRAYEDAAGAPEPKMSLAEWLEPKLGFLKSALTERSFVCFLTGRDYLEKLHRARQVDPHGILHTLYSDYFFLQYLPGELHTFVRSLLTDEPSADPATREREERDLAVIPFVVLYRAQLQPIDVRRQLLALVGPTGELALGRVEATGVLSPMEQNELFAQIVIESMLEEPFLKGRLESDSHFALLAIDTVYFAIRAWQGLNAHLDVSMEGFEAYLKARTRTTDGHPSPLAETDLVLLYGAMRTVVSRLADPSLLQSALVDAAGAIVPWLVQRCGGDPGAQRVMGIVPRAPRDALLEPAAGGGDRFRWRSDAFGRTLVTDDTIQLLRTLCAQIEELKEVDRGMAELGIPLDALREPYGLFQVPNVTWPAILAAQRAAATAVDSNSGYTGMTADARMLESYVAGVDEALPIIDRAVDLANALRGDKPLTTALTVLSESLKLRTRTAKDRLAALEEAWRGVGKSFGAGDSLPPVVLTERKGLGSPLLWVKDSGPSLLEHAVVEREYWRTWELRIMARLIGRTEMPSTSWAELAWSIARDRRSTLVQRAWEENTPSAWTQLALAAAIGVPASDGDRYPTWMVAAALGSLGLAPLAVAWAMPDKLSSEWISAMSAGRDLPLVLVIAESPASPTWEWPASGGYGVLVVTANQLESLARAFAGAWQRAQELTRTLHAPIFLADGDQHSVDDPVLAFPALSDEAWGNLSTRYRSAWIVTDAVDASRDKAPAGPNAGLFVRGAASVDEAAAKLLAHEPGSRRRSS